MQVDLSETDEHFVAVLRWNFLPGSFHLPRFEFLFTSRGQLASKRRYDFWGDPAKWNCNKD